MNGDRNYVRADIPHSHGCCSLSCCPSQQEQHAISRSAARASRFGWDWHHHTLSPRSFGVDNRSRPGTLVHNGTFARGSSARRCACSRPAQAKLPRDLDLDQQSVAFVWGASCLQYRGRSARRQRNSTAEICGTPKKASVQSFPTSPECFGRRAQPQRSRRLRTAAFAMSSFTSPASKNGQAMPSRSSSAKSCAGTE